MLYRSKAVDSLLGGTKRFWKHEQETNDYTCFDSSVISVSLDWLIMDFERFERNFRQWVDNLDLVH
jgi:hypothetical protein